MADQRIQIKGFIEDITSEMIFSKYTGVCEVFVVVLDF